MIYTTGTIAGNGSTITGTGTNFTAAGSLIRVGCTLIAFTNPVQVLQITAITNGTTLSVTPVISPAITAGTKYAILLSDSLSVDGLAQDIAETFGMYQKYMSGFADVMNGSSDVTITINGVAVTVPGQKSLAKRGANTDITSLGGLTTALSVGQGGTGGKSQVDAQNGLGFGKSGPVKGVNPSSDSDWDSLSANQFFNVKIAGSNSCIGSTQIDGAWATFLSVRHRNGNPGDGNSYGFVLYDASMSTTSMNSFTIQKQNGGGAWSSGAVLYHTRNTTKATDGTLKAASPVVKLFSDGRAETNDESEGVTVMRQGVGEYLLEGCMGLNADATWGGIDGGFDIPTDRNKQPLIWLDYKINADGSILVKTYHRTYPNAPVFARNIRDGYESGDPIDIPTDQFVSVRVEMPENSIWNQKQAAAQKAMEEAERERQLKSEQEDTQPDA